MAPGFPLSHPINSVFPQVFGPIEVQHPGDNPWTPLFLGPDSPPAAQQRQHQAYSAAPQHRQQHLQPGGAQQLITLLVHIGKGGHPKEGPHLPGILVFPGIQNNAKYKKVEKMQKKYIKNNVKITNK